MKRPVLAMLLVTSAAMADKDPSNGWPTGALRIDNNDDEGGALSIQFTDADNKKHDIELVFDFNTARIQKCTFDDQVLDKIPQWRALSKYFVDHHMGSYRADDVLACTHPSVDKANETNPECSGWKDSAEDHAEDIAKNGPPFDPARAAKVGVVLYVRPTGEPDGNGAGGKWDWQYVQVEKVIKNDPKAAFKDELTIAFLSGQKDLPPGEGTIYLEQVKDERGKPIWALLGGDAKQGSSDWFRDP